MILNLSEISQTLDKMLDQPAAEWSLNQIQLYQLLDQKLKKYRRKFIEAQFLQDQTDIIDNLIEQPWYKKSLARSAINQLLQQMRIMSYSLTRHNPQSLQMKFVIRFRELHLDLKLEYSRSPEQMEYFLYFEPLPPPTNSQIAQNIQNSQNAPQTPSRRPKAYLAKYHLALPARSQVPELDRIYSQYLANSPSQKIPGQELMKIVAEIILFYEETGTILNSPLSPQSNWTLADSLAE